MNCTGQLMLMGGELKVRGTNGTRETNWRNKNEHNFSDGTRFRDRQFRRSRVS